MSFSGSTTQPVTIKGVEISSLDISGQMYADPDTGKCTGAKGVVDAAVGPDERLVLRHDSPLTQETRV